jgi:major membrane immunogen (membrane-anchored lipoprotein)
MMIKKLTANILSELKDEGYTALILASAVFLFGCGQSDKSQTDSSAVETTLQEGTEDINEVRLSAQRDTLAISELADTLSIKMINYTPANVTTGLHYSVDMFENNQWATVTPKDMAFNDIGYRLLPGDSQDFVIRLFKDTIHYRPGKYRIGKYFMASDYDKHRESHHIYAEFEVR